MNARPSARRGREALPEAALDTGHAQRPPLPKAREEWAGILEERVGRQKRNSRAKGLTVSSLCPFPETAASFSSPLVTSDTKHLWCMYVTDYTAVCQRSRHFAFHFGIPIGLMRGINK